MYFLIIESFVVVNSQENKNNGLGIVEIMIHVAPELVQLNVLIEESCVLLNSEGRCYDGKQHTRRGSEGDCGCVGA